MRDCNAALTFSSSFVSVSASSLATLLGCTSMETKAQLLDFNLNFGPAIKDNKDSKNREGDHFYFPQHANHGQSLMASVGALAYHAFQGLVDGLFNYLPGSQVFSNLTCKLYFTSPFSSHN